MKGVRRVLPGSGQPFERFWKVVDAATSESGEGELWFYGFISEYSWDQDDITPGLMREDLERFGGKPITLRIHSAGGEVFAASAIRSMLMAYPGYVTAKIEGLCASAATYVAMAADRVLMQDSAYFMVHDPWTVAMGGAKEFAQVVKMLMALKKGIVETYQSKTALGEDVLAKMMEEETWMSAQKALELGFVDEVISERSASVQFEELARAANLAVVNALPDFAKVPDEVREMVKVQKCDVDHETKRPTPFNPPPVEGGNSAQAVPEEVKCGEQSEDEEMKERADSLREKIDDVKNRFGAHGGNTDAIIGTEKTHPLNPPTLEGAKRAHGEDAMQNSKKEAMRNKNNESENNKKKTNGFRPHGRETMWEQEQRSE